MNQHHKTLLYTLSLWELEALRQLVRSALDAHSVGNSTACKKLCGIAESILGAFDWSDLIIVNNFIAIAWVERTPALSPGRLKQAREIYGESAHRTRAFV